MERVGMDHQSRPKPIAQMLWFLLGTACGSGGANGEDTVNGPSGTSDEVEDTTGTSASPEPTTGGDPDEQTSGDPGDDTTATSNGTTSSGSSSDGGGPAEPYTECDPAQDGSCPSGSCI